MKTSKLLKGVTLLAALLLVSCGSDNRSEAENKDAVEYFSQFITADNGVPVAEDLVFDEASYVSNFFNASQQQNMVFNGTENLKSVKLRVDKNGTCLFYAADADIPESRQDDIQGVECDWRIEDDRLILDGVVVTFQHDIGVASSSIDRFNETNSYFYNASFNNVNSETIQNANTSNCFGVLIENTHYLNIMNINPATLNNNNSFNGYYNSNQTVLIQDDFVKFCKSYR